MGSALQPKTMRLKGASFGLFTHSTTRISLQEQSSVSVNYPPPFLPIPPYQPPPFSLQQQPWPVCFRVRALPLGLQFTVWGFLQMATLPDQFLSLLNSTISASSIYPSFSILFLSVSCVQLLTKKYKSTLPDPIYHFSYFTFTFHLFSNFILFSQKPRVGKGFN